MMNKSNYILSEKSNSKKNSLSKVNRVQNGNYNKYALSVLLQKEKQENEKKDSISYTQFMKFQKIIEIMNIPKIIKDEDYHKILYQIISLTKFTELELIYFHLFLMKLNHSTLMSFEEHVYLTAFFVKKLLNSDDIYYLIKNLAEKFTGEELFLEKFEIWMTLNSDYKSKLVSITEVNMHFADVYKNENLIINKNCKVHINYNKLVDNLMINKKNIVTSKIEDKPGKYLNNNTKKPHKKRKSSKSSQKNDSSIQSAFTYKDLVNSVELNLNDTHYTGSVNISLLGKKRENNEKENIINDHIDYLFDEVTSIYNASIRENENKYTGDITNSQNNIFVDETNILFLNENMNYDEINYNNTFQIDFDAFNTSQYNEYNEIYKANSVFNDNIDEYINETINQDYYLDYKL